MIDCRVGSSFLAFGIAFLAYFSDEHETIQNPILKYHDLRNLPGAFLGFHVIAELAGAARIGVGCLAAGSHVAR